VTENKKLDELLREFQEKKNHMAVVVDEYGGSSGVISLEDIIEEIVGEISDEFDEDQLAYSKLDDNNYVFEGKTALMDMYRILDISGERFENAKGDSDSIAGFILELTGKIPQKNEKIRFEHFLFTIEAADKRRVKRIKVTINNEEDHA
jgi:putative hemolysin